MENASNLHASHFFMSYYNENANLSLKNYSETCDVAYSFRESPKVVTITAINTLMGFLNLIVLCLLFNNKEVRRVWNIVCTDLKFVIATGFVFYAGFSINALIFFAYNTFIYLSNLAPCDYIFKGRNCYYFQVVHMAVYIRGFFMFHLILFVERAFVSFIGPIRKLRIGEILSCVMIMVTAYFPMFMDSRVYENDRVACFSPVTVTDTSVNWKMLSNILLDSGITFLDFLLFLWNKHKMRKYRTLLAYSTLENKFNRREIEISISIIYPYSLVHSIGYICQIYSYLWFTSEVKDIGLHDGVFRYGLVSLTRLVSSLACLIFLLVYVKLRARSSNVVPIGSDYTEAHFREFNRIIS